MSPNELVQRFPNKRLVAADGMAVTADIWNLAHDYHRGFLAAHFNSIYGTGIVTGLEVTADNPPGQHVHVSPGIAIDHYGQIIVVAAPQAYNLRNQEGTVHLILTYSEGSPRSEANAEGADSPRFAQIGYSLEAKTALPEEPYVELARIRRPTATIAVTNAKNPESPTTCEIDLRFRGRVLSSSAQPATIAVNTLDAQVANEHVIGWQNFARELRHTTMRPIWIEPNIALESELPTYPLLCLVAAQGFNLSRIALTRIHEYLHKGGILLFESCRRSQSRGVAEADSALERLVEGMGGQLLALPANHPLMQKPYFFPQLPAGYEQNNAGSLRIAQGIGKGIILHSTLDYGCVWAGTRGRQSISREELRAAFEWGNNLLTFALDYQQQHKPQKGLLMSL